ncbi:SMP-30/gluconolactonase/LRE family protein [Christensenellaceae bacterium NSJ-44]|uniref:SMP-30/gluconolactonase/LRE family protein n=1 Tax=Luoshenia tenuis TaxID=2763654 RepID=A0A926D218_9FIRM|nr:SMP-30/gluconolactonase/LRE family protein [Luoshenia tenuis]MBC8529514.1 SMP-30/gluconolactonase/LRE family protein [Luoshenia tenuis]
MDYLARVVLNSRCALGEGPVWDERAGLLYFTDITGKALHRLDPVSGACEVMRPGFQVGAFALCQGSDELVLAGENGFYRAAWLAKPRRICLVPARGENRRFNDGKCDPAGRFLAGVMHNAQTPVGVLYSLAGQTATPLLEGLRCPNGLCWTQDGRTLYYADSPTQEIRAYDYDPSTGALSGGRVAVRIRPEEGVPDGMTIDSQGKLWVAQWGGWQVGHYDPQTGEKLGKVDVPAHCTSSCVFGGADFKTLYITTARRPDEPAASPAGDIFAVHLPVAGLPFARFAG